MQPLAAAAENDLTRSPFSTAPHRHRFRTRRKRYKSQPWCQLHVGDARGVPLAPQHLQMEQLCPSDAGSKLGLGHDDGFDFCPAKARLVVIGLEERMRAAA